MKRKSIKIVLTVVFIGLVLSGVGLYIYDVFYKGDSPTKNLFKLIMLAITGVAGIVKLYSGGNGKSLAYYEKSYSSEIKNAFVDNPKAKKQLLGALRSYNENRFDSAIKKLTTLRQKCETHADCYATELFIALSYTDMGAAQSAVSVYENMLRCGLVSATVYGNLGSLYASLGMKDEALEVYTLAVNTYPDAHIAYNNLAQLEFGLGDMESAKVHAHRAVEINYKSYQAASLLAIIYMLEGNDEEEKKYTRLAVGGGQNMLSLEQAKAYYKRLYSDDDGGEGSEDFESDE